LSPVTENPEPEIASDVMVKGAVPVEVTVTDFETAVPIETLPNRRELALSVSVGADAFNWIPKLWAEELALAVIVAVCAVLTDAAVAVNAPAEAPAGIIMPEGTVSAPVLLESATA